MNLRKYDNKLVKITDIDNIEYEGYCCHNSKDYNEVEYGKKEESLEILNIMFYKFDIKKIEIIDKFSNEKYGNLEKLIGEDEDTYFIEDALDFEDEIHKKRLLDYLKDNINRLKNKEEINRIIEKYSK